MKNISASYKLLDRDFTRDQFIEQFGVSTFPQVVSPDGTTIGGATATVVFLKEQGILP